LGGSPEVARELLESSSPSCLTYLGRRRIRKRWTANHEGTFLLSLDEAADLARRLNARSWGEALNRIDGETQSTLGHGS
jgi:hypothetical protein